MVSRAAISYATDGKKETFGDLFFDKNEHPFLNVGMEFLNPINFIVPGVDAGAALSQGKRGLFSNSSRFVRRIPKDENSAYRLVLGKGAIDDAMNTGVFRSFRYEYPHFRKGSPYKGISKNDEFIIRTPINNDFGRYDAHISNAEDLFSGNNLAVGESVTPAIDGVPIFKTTKGSVYYRKVPFGYIETPFIGSGFSNKSNYGNIKFIRNVSDVPEIKNGKVMLSPENNALTNMTYDQSFRTHRNYSTRPGGTYMIIDPEAFSGKNMLSIEPMDTFLKNEPIDKKFITIISGDENVIKKAESMGYKTATSNKLKSIYKNAVSETTEKQQRINLGKSGVQNSSLSNEYDDAINELIRKKYGSPTTFSTKALENSSGLNAGVSGDVNFNEYALKDFYDGLKTLPMSEVGNHTFTYPNGRTINAFSKNKGTANYVNLFYDPFTESEYNLLKKYGVKSHPNNSELSDDIINTIIEDIGSKKLRNNGGKIYYD